MIPKIIHYCWFGGNELNDLAKKCIDSWKNFCPDYEIIEWNESNFDVSINSFCKDAYDSEMWAFVSDYARLYIVYNYGGIYLDTDVELLKPLEPLLDNKCFLGIEVDSGYIATGLGFGAEKKNEAIGLMLSKYNHLVFKKNDTTINCPVLNTEPFYDYGFELGKDELLDVGISKIYPSEYFCPVNYSTGVINITENTFSIHHYAASWNSNKQKDFHNLKVKAIKKYGEGKKADNYYLKHARLLEIKYLFVNKEYKRMPELICLFFKNHLLTIFKKF